MDRPENVPDDWVLVTCSNPPCGKLVWVPPELEGGPPNLSLVCSTECSKAMVKHFGAMDLLDASPELLAAVEESQKTEAYQAHEKGRMCAVCRRILDDWWDYELNRPIGYRHAFQDEVAQKEAGQEHHPVAVPIDHTVLLPRCDFCNKTFAVDEEIWTLPAGDFHVMGNFFNRGDWACCVICAELVAANRWAILTRRVIETYVRNHPGEKNTPGQEVFDVWYQRLRAVIKGPPYLESELEVQDGR